MRWLDSQPEQNLFLSCLTIGELTKGVMRMPPGVRRNRLRDWIEKSLPSRFEGRILSIDCDIAARWGRIAADALGRGDVLPVIDGLMAATAECHDLTVATRNEVDFGRCAVPVINPWHQELR
jgi:predicted nucleic acid-binding protein